MDRLSEAEVPSRVGKMTKKAIPRLSLYQTLKQRQRPVVDLLHLLFRLDPWVEWALHSSWTGHLQLSVTFLIFQDEFSPPRPKKKSSRPLHNHCIHGSTSPR